ncbi:MAG: hypothetical protein CSB47_04405 [Proteobacteria bacterium]|nr:MAG: hypothetical protein CSB47_04405 [Pseudomonadota bacterium]
MKIFFSIIVVLILAVCTYFAYLSAHETTPDVGMVNGKLRPCPSTPNCVSSEATDEKFIEPFKATATIGLGDLWDATIRAIKEQGGVIQVQEDDYVWATFQSRLFKFTDDVELRRDNPSKTIHVRSGSRCGQSDLGVNRKRVEALRVK